MSDPRSKANEQAVLLSSVDDVEAAFYDAMQLADLDRMMALWADDDDVACVHPGGLRLVGGEAIRAGFEAVFSHGAVQVTLVNVRRIDAAGVSIHHVLEKVQIVTAEGLQTAYVLASNVYLHSAQGWRMVLHHASPGQQDAMQEMTEMAPVLH
jgi:ketosteroid isomerase-like protein